jgi:hypothetical protein
MGSAAALVDFSFSRARTRTRTVPVVDPNLGRLVAGEVGPPASSIVSASNQLAFDADERSLNNRVSHEKPA